MVLVLVAKRPSASAMGPERPDTLVERLFALLHDCDAIARQLAPGPEREESKSAEAERLLYYALAGAIEARLVRTTEDVLTVLRQASKPLGPMGRSG